MSEEVQDGLHAITVPIGRWLIRTDDRLNMKTPIMAYGMESCVLIVWSDGSHTIGSTMMIFPASNWKVWESE